MYKHAIVYFALIFLLLFPYRAEGQIDTLWERSAQAGNRPSWFGANTERGLDYGVVNGNPRLYVVSRGDGTTVRILDALTGSDVGILGTQGVTGGTFPLNDVGVTDDGVILAGNLSLGQTFKVYKWDDEQLPGPELVIEYQNANRLGDSFFVRGSWSDGTAALYAATATNVGHVYRWTMENGQFVATPDTIFLSDNTPGTAAAVGVLPDGTFYWNANGSNAKKYSATGTLLGSIPGGVLGTASNSIRWIGNIGDNEIIATHQYGTGNNNARIIRVPQGLPQYAITYLLTPTLGSESNPNGTGDVSVVDHGDGTATVFVLSTNNGIGAYRIDMPKIGWANLQWPPAATITEGDTLDVYAQVWAPGITDADGNEDQIFVEIGYHTENTHPLQWAQEQWFPAVFNNRQGNNYEYVGRIGFNLPPGSYYYASRFTIGNEVVFGGYNQDGGHFWNGSTSVSGTLTVVGPALLGTYYIPQGDQDKGFASLREAIEALNELGADGPVTFIIADTLDEGPGPITLDRGDLSESTRVTIRPAPDTNPVIKVEEIRFVDTGYITIDGSSDGSTDRELTFKKIETSGSIFSFLKDTKDMILRNVVLTYHGNLGYLSYPVLINRWTASGEPIGRSENLLIENVKFGSEEKRFDDGIWLFGDHNASPAGVHLNTRIVGNEFYVHRSALRTQTHANTLFEGNTIKIYARTDAQALNLNTPLEGFTARNNEFEFVGGTMSQPAVHAVLNITNTLVESYIYNNTIAINYDGEGTAHSFYAVRHVGTATTGPLHFYHNTFRINDTGQTGTHAVFGNSDNASTGAVFNVVNNIMVSARDSANSIGFHWNRGVLNSDYNNLYFPGDALVGKVGDDEYATLQEWRATNRDQNSVSVAVEFVADDDLRLAGNSIGDVSLAGTFVGVTHDIDGNPRSPRAPTMGAHEPVDLQPPARLQAAWKVPVNSVPWLANDNTTRGIAYNPASDHILVVSRTGAPNIRVLSAATGLEVGQLDLTGVSGGFFPLNEIAVTRDGQIFSAPLVLSGGTMNIYYWENEQVAPKIVWTGNIGTKRYGDAVGVWGTGDDAAFYISGTGNDKIAKFVWTNGVGSMLEGPHYIEVPEGRARGGIAEVVGEDSLWINGFGTGWYTKKIHYHDGGIGTRIPLDVLPGATMDIAYWEFGGRKLVSAGVSGTTPGDQYFRIVDVTDPSRMKVVALTDSLGPNPNVNATGGTAFDPVRGRVIVLSTNNAVASFNLAPDVLEEFDPLITLAAARTLPQGTPVMVQGIITSPDFGFNNAEFYMQDETGGMKVRWVGFGGGNDPDTPFAAGHKVQIVGQISSRFDELQISPSSYEIISTGNPLPDPIDVTAAHWVVDSPYQGMRVRLQNVFLPEDAPWPTQPITEGSGMTTFMVSEDLADTFQVRIDRDESHFDGSPRPVGIVNVAGNMGRFWENVQIFPFFEGDIEIAVSVAEEDKGAIPLTYSLEQNFPNPFNPSTTIRFSLPEATNVRLEIYNVMGQRVKVLIRDELYNPGIHDVVWHGVNDYNMPVASGMYIYRLTAGDFTAVKRMMFLK